MNNTFTDLFFVSSVFFLIGYDNLYQNFSLFDNLKYYMDKLFTPLNVVYILLFALLCRVCDKRHREILLIAVFTCIIANYILT
jgi:hypothetical protein